MKYTLIVILEMLVMLAGITIILLGTFPFAILILFAAAWLSLYLRHLRWRDVGLRRPENVLKTIALAILIGIGYQLLDIFLISPFLQSITGESINLSAFSELRGNLLMLLLFLLIAWTEAAFIEELYFRGYLFNRLADLFSSQQRGTISALIVSSFIFAIGHTYQGITGILDTFLAGLLLGLLYLLARRNLWLPLLVHGVVDTLGFMFIYAGLAG